jgi:DoxX-like family
MTAVAQTSSVVQKRVVAGYILSALVVLFLTFDTVMKVLRLAPAVQGTTQLGYPAGTVLWIGLIATHVRIGSPLLGYTLFPIYVALLVWGGLYLREARLRELVPFRRQNG